MDYSLLLGIHDLDRSVEDALEQVEEEDEDEDYDSGGSAGNIHLKLQIRGEFEVKCRQRSVIQVKIFNNLNLPTA